MDQYIHKPLKIYPDNRRYKNFFYLKKIIFPPISDYKIKQIMIDEESIKYITFNSAAQQITSIIMNSLEDFPCPDKLDPEKWRKKISINKTKKLVITDATAGVGGNVLNFARYFAYVNAIEIDEIRYCYLNKNIELYELDNINCYCNDSLIVLIENDDLVQDIIFFDPPWGGKDYKLHPKLRLSFGNYSIESVCQTFLLRKSNKMLVLKLPNNYDFEYFESELSGYKIEKFNLDRMTIVIVKNY